MLISNKLHSFRNFFRQSYAHTPCGGRKKEIYLSMSYRTKVSPASLSFTFIMKPFRLESDR